MNETRKSAMIYMLSGVIGVGAFGVPALAEGPGPCAADIQKFCADVQPGGGAIVQCLKKHEADLSEACKQRGKDLKQKLQAFEVACQQDSDKYCKDVQPGQGRKIKCLKDNEANLSSDCKAQMAHMHTSAHFQPSGTPSQPPAAPPH